MITGIQDLYYNVADMPRAVAFYRDLLGFTVLDSDPYWTSLSLDNLRVGLHGTDGTPVPPIPHDAHGAHAGATLTLRSDDLDADVARFTASGVTFLGPPSHNPWGSLAVFTDPDGNILKLMQPPRADGL